MDWKTVVHVVGDAVGNWSGVVTVASLIVAALIINRIVHFVCRRVAKHYKVSTSVWINALARSLEPPLRVFVWFLGIMSAYHLLIKGNDLRVLAVVVDPLRSVILTLIVVWFCFRLVHILEANAHAHGRHRGQMIDPMAVDGLGKLARIAIVVITVLTLMQTFGVSITGLLAFGGAAGIAVGFAAQSLVANLFGGLTIFATRIFRIGEDIIIPGTNLSGTVQHIGWRATRVLGWDYKPFYVPNSLFNTSTIINHTRMRNRRIMEYVYLRLEDIDKVSAIIAGGNEMIATHPEMDHEFWVLRFDSYGTSALKLFLYGYAATTSYAEYMRIKEDVLLKLATIVEQHDAKLAVPASTVYMPEGVALNAAGIDPRTDVAVVADGGVMPPERT